MTRLLVAELRRIAARRIVRVVLVVAAIAIVGGGALAFAKSSAQSESTYQQRVRAAHTQLGAERTAAESCLRAHGGVAGRDVSQAVRDECIPSRFASAHDPRFHRSRLRDILKGSSGVLAIVGWALGASLVGAEFASRGMTTLLTWESRRLRVFLVKAGVAVAAGAAFAALALVATGLALLPSLLLHGAPLRSIDPSWLSIAGVVGRGTALVAITTALGFAIASLGRSTAAALGVGFASIVVLENILGNALPGWRRWLLLGNAIVFISGNKGGGDVPGRSVAGAALFLSAVAATFLVAAAGAFRVRDIE